MEELLFGPYERDGTFHSLVVGEESIRVTYSEYGKHDNLFLHFLFLHFRIPNTANIRTRTSMMVPSS